MPSENLAFIVDAFTTATCRFTGNPAAVCLINKQLTDEEYQKLGAEFNLSETAFPCPLEQGADFVTGKTFSLRWFTPTVEVGLCGHATLATAHVLFNEIDNQHTEIEFQVRMGKLVVGKLDNGKIRMDFPQFELGSVDIPELKLVGLLKDHFPITEDPGPGVIQALVKLMIPENLTISGVYYAPNVAHCIIVLAGDCTKSQFMSIGNCIDEMTNLDMACEFLDMVSITVNCREFVNDNGEPYDFVSRTFAPWAGIPEDPATGSAHCGLGPLWSRLSNKKFMKAFQAFPGRGAEFQVNMKEDNRIELIGNAVTVMKGNLCL